MTVFYEKFERHAHGEGLKGHATHYCARVRARPDPQVHRRGDRGTGHPGPHHRRLPVGCSVFLYYYLDVGNTQAAHGRAPAVGVGHKVANPNAIVLAYQGDGDLASIGLAEIMQACQMGLPMTFIFVNNAIYGMTGGQMAPTTLPGQKTATTPEGRPRLAGEPLRMAEIVSQIDGPVFVERLRALRPQATHAGEEGDQKALTLQVENRGLAFVEILSECPTHLKLSPSRPSSGSRTR